ncbi:hypothetical protein ACIA8I_37785 [Streptomyces rishiriensis]|uniref:hypothetical protein n=1 Tax=Streptomyces rishiriensis TaxID=68264 RepID=UPI0037965F92
MSTPRRPLGTGPRPHAPAPAARPGTAAQRAAAQPPEPLADGAPGPHTGRRTLGPGQEQPPPA